MTENAVTATLAWGITQATGRNPISGERTADRAAFEETMAAMPSAPH